MQCTLHVAASNRQYGLDHGFEETVDASDNASLEAGDVVTISRPMTVDALGTVVKKAKTTIAVKAEAADDEADEGAVTAAEGEEEEDADELAEESPGEEADEDAVPDEDEVADEDAVPDEDEVADEDAVPEEEVEEVADDDEGDPTNARDAHIPDGSEHLYDGVTYENEVLPTTETELVAMYKMHDSACRRVRFHMREMGFAKDALNMKDAVRGGVTEKAQELVRLVHVGTLNDVLEFCYSREGTLFADAAEQRLGSFEARQKRHAKGKGKGKGKANRAESRWEASDWQSSRSSGWRGGHW